MCSRTAQLETATPDQATLPQESRVMKKHPRLCARTCMVAKQMEGNVTIYIVASSGRVAVAMVMVPIVAPDHKIVAPDLKEYFNIN